MRFHSVAFSFGRMAEIVAFLRCVLFSSFLYFSTFIPANDVIDEISGARDSSCSRATVLWLGFFSTCHERGTENKLPSNGTEQWRRQEMRALCSALSSKDIKLKWSSSPPLYFRIWFRRPPPSPWHRTLHDSMIFSNEWHCGIGRFSQVQTCIRLMCIKHQQNSKQLRWYVSWCISRAANRSVWHVAECLFIWLDSMGYGFSW